jgi:predicted dehydrogenase
MNVLIIGLGSIAKKHISALNNLIPQLTIYALRSSSHGEQMPGVINIPNIHEVGISPDFVIISNPTFLHVNTIIEALQFNCPLFIEKPISHSLEGLEILEKKIMAANILTYVGCNLRFHSCLQFVRNFLSSHPDERINEINLYCGAYLPEWRNGKDSYSFYVEKGGGVHLDLIHELDYLYWIFGSPQEIKSLHRSVSSIGATSIDYANYLLIYKGFTANVVLNYYRRDAKRVFELVFNDKTWLVDIFENKIMQGDKVIFEDSKRVTDTYILQMKYFLDSLNEGNISMNSFSEALEVLKICLHDTASK